MAREIITPIYSSTSEYITSAIGSMSIRPSRTQQGVDKTASPIRGSLEGYPSSAGQKTTLEILVGVLQKSDLPGPVILCGSRKYLGKGSQFVVHEQTMAWPEFEHFSTRQIATKQPIVTLNPNLRLNLASQEVQENLHDVYIEILALTSPRLRTHPNIARLFAWSFDSYNFHSPLNLVMELASCDLAAYLAENGDKTSLALKYWFCRDIGAGLDALHECGFIHGDLKPENVLVFHDGGYEVAKIADFGLSIDEAACLKSTTRLFGTFGWQAPEVVEGLGLSATQLPKADNYSFGLVIWSVLLYSGKVPTKAGKDSRQSLAKKELAAFAGNFGMSPNSVLPDIMYQLLNEEANERPERVEGLFQDENKIGESYFNETASEDDHLSEDSDASQVPQDQKYMSWEMPGLTSYFVHDLYSRFLDSPTSIPADTLFTMYLSLTLAPPEVAESKNPALDVLVVSALNGYEPAQAAVPAAYEFFELNPPEEVRKHVVDWLESAVASGSTLAKSRLQGLNSVTYHDSLQTFHSSGGYNSIFCTIDPSEDHSKLPRDAGYSEIHWLATYGTQFELSSYLDRHLGCELDVLTENEETPLYLACARGSRDVAVELLSRGASPSIKCTYFGISCMHWIFAFDEGSQNDMVLKLIGHGADLNAKTSYEVPFLHYPFRLPSGTPLHWAVSTFSHSTVKILIEHGADVLIRDGSDPYVYDDRARILNKFGGPNQEAYSFSETGTQGLSSLDLAAMQHDPFIFETLLSLSKEVKINDTDEEGFTVLHRLSNKHVDRTRMKNQFLTLPFKGSRIIRETELGRTIEAIKALGGHLEQLTASIGSISQEAQRGWDFPSYTPLMLAVLISSTEVIKALLDAGSSVSMENQEGDTALQFLPEDPEFCLECVQLLVANGADIGHRNKLGASPLLKAAQFALMDLVDYFLSEGANIEERETSETSPNSTKDGTSIFAFLAYEDSAFNEDNDLKVVQILEKFVLSCPDHEKKRRVMEQGDADGETLLHRFASRAMVRCVEALIAKGAPVNAIHRCYTREYEGDVEIKVSWHETPLNAAINTKEWRVKQMMEDKKWSHQGYENLCRRDDNIIAILKGAGGKVSSKEIWRSPIHFPLSHLGGGRMRQALRDS